MAAVVGWGLGPAKRHGTKAAYGKIGAAGDHLSDNGGRFVRIYPFGTVSPSMSISFANPPVRRSVDVLFALSVAGVLWLLGLWCLVPVAHAQAREVRVGVYQNAPKIFAGDRGQPTGILGDLLVEIANAEGWTLLPVPCDWQACLNALVAGEIDLMPDVAYTEDRALLFDFHATPALLSWSQLYRHPQVRIDNALDLNGKRVAVLEGSVQQQYLSNLVKGFGLHTEFVVVQSLKEAFEKVAERTVDAAAANRFFGDLQSSQYRLEPTPLMFQPSQLFYATTKTRNADLLRAIDQRLTRWQAQPADWWCSHQRLSNPKCSPVRIGDPRKR